MSDDEVIKLTYMDWVNSLPKNHQQNLLDSLEKNESMTYNAFKAAYTIGEVRGQLKQSAFNSEQVHGVKIDANPLSATYGKNISPWGPTGKGQFDL